MKINKSEDNIYNSEYSVLNFVHELEKLCEKHNVGLKFYNGFCGDLGEAEIIKLKCQKDKDKTKLKIDFLDLDNTNNTLYFLSNINK